MVKKSAFISGIFIASTCIQFVTQLVMTRAFGARLEFDVFLAAVTIPTIIVTVIYSTLNDAYLPLYGKRRQKEPHEADNDLFSFIIQLCVLTLLTAVVFGLSSHLISVLLFAKRGDAFVREVATQIQIMTYSTVPAVIATLLGVYFYTTKQFFRFPLAQLMGAVFNLIFIVLFIPVIGIWAATISFLLSIIFQILFVLPKQLLAFRWRPVHMMPIMASWLPLAIGAFALRSDVLFIRSFASYLPEGYFVYLNLIYKIFSLSTGLMTIGIQILLLPHLVELFTNRAYKQANQMIVRTKITAIVLSILISFAIMIIAPFIIRLLFVGGKFTIDDAQATIALLPFFILPAIGWGISGIFFQPLFALHKQLHVGLLNILAVVLAIGASIILRETLGTLPTLTISLIILLFTGIIGSEILWQYYKRRLPV